MQIGRLLLSTVRRGTERAARKHGGEWIVRNRKLRRLSANPMVSEWAETVLEIEARNAGLIDALEADPEIVEAVAAGDADALVGADGAIIDAITRLLESLLTPERIDQLIRLMEAIMEIVMKIIDALA